MKGLILKDLMCLRKQRTTFIFIVSFTAVISIMYVLSARFGNIYFMNQQMMAKEGVTGIDVKNISVLVLIAFMLLPFALVGDVTTIFSYDGKAGFANVCSTLPLSINKRVMAKFLTILIMFGIGLGVDLAISLVLSCFAEDISFTDLMSIILFAASIVCIYSALTIFFCITLGYGKETYAQIFYYLFYRERN